MQNYRDYTDIFYASHYIPIALYENGKFIHAAGFYEDGDPYPFVFEKLCEMESPALHVSGDTGYFGMIKCPDGIHSFILGPAYATPITEDFVRTYMNKNAISITRYADIFAYLSGIPQYTYNKFINLLVYQHFVLTGEKKSIVDSFGLTDTGFESIIGQKHSEKSYVDREEQRTHGTYPFEMQMLDLIKQGDVEKLNAFLLQATKMPNMDTEGKLAETPLRQAKNLFIGLVTVIGKFAAIPGGMDVEETYQLIDTYIQECERLQSEETVKNLQYNMPIDFARRVGQQKLPEGISKELYTLMQFIKAHINEPISVDDIIEVSGKSRAYLFKKFKTELGMGIGEYISYCRLREAKSLLRYTDKPISEISNYLCYSSQSHFQNAFKKHYSETPSEYRKRTLIKD